MSIQQPVYILEHASGKAVEALLVTPLTEKQIEDWRSLWRPRQAELLKRLEESGIPTHEWPQHRHWSWEQKQKQLEGLLAYRGFAVEYEDVTQGMMFVNLTRSCRLNSQTGKPLVYLEFLEVAPWNRPQFGEAPRFQGVGSLLVATAINLSHDEGFQGRVGLHSLRQSDAFYRDKCGMTEVGLDHTYNSLRYFEMTAPQAEAFKKKGERA